MKAFLFLGVIFLALCAYAAGPGPTTEPAGVAGLRHDLQDLVAAATRGDRAAVLKYVGPASARKQQAFAGVIISALQAGDAFESRFHEAPTGFLAGVVEHFAAWPKDRYYMKPDGSAASSMLHFVKGDGGLWQIDLAEIHPHDDAGLEAVEQANQLIEGWTKSVRAGEYATPLVASQAFEGLKSDLKSRRATTRPH